MEVYHIPLPRGKQTLVSPEDADLAQYKWHANSYGYAVRYTGPRSDYRCILLHRVILSRVLGRPLIAGEEVDHIDGNPLNNTRENLRPATHRQNGQNTKTYKNNRSGQRGVYFDRGRGKWAAEIYAPDKRHFLGRFDTLEEAAEIYRVAAEQYFGEWLRR